MKKNIKSFISVFKIKTAEGLQYRTAALAGSMTGIFWALIEITVYTIFYTYAQNKNAGFDAGFTLKHIVSYMWLNQILFNLQPMNIEDDIRTKIVNGDVGVELIRPMPLYLNWFSKISASRIPPLLLRGSITIAVAIIMPYSYRISPPESLSAFLLFLLSVISAFFLCSAYGMLITAVRMSVPWGDGPTYMLMLIGGILSGGYLPLKLWPDFMQNFLLYQPFAGYLDIPLRFYLGFFNINGAFSAITVQILWTAVFIFAGNLLLKKNIKTIIIQGG